MSAVSSLGVGSGLELGSLVDNLVSIERQSAEGPLNRRQSRTELRLSALGSLRSSVASLAAAVSGLESLQIGRAVQTSWSEAVTGTATATADTAGYLINVQQLAVAQSLASDDASPFADATSSLGQGTLTVAVGGSSANITLASGSDSLNYVRDQINASGIGVHAAVVQDGSNYRLLLTSDETGLDGQMTLTVTGTVDTRLTSASMDETTAAADAQFSVNGLSLTSSSNTIDGVVPGVTLELHGATGSESVSLDVVADTGGLAEKLSSVVDAYNALVGNMQALGGASADGSSAGPLVGDASLRALQRQTGSIFSLDFQTDVTLNPFRNMVAVGVHKQLDGYANLNVAELESALDDNEAGVEALVSGFADYFSEALAGFEGSNGILTHRTDQLNGELKTIASQREDLDRRMSGVEARLRARFSALDSLVSQFNSTSSFLQQQLANLPKISSSSSK